MEIKVYESVGNIKFGASRETVRKNNGPYKEFKKSRFSKNTTDDFSGFQVFYNEDNTVCAVEIFRETELLFRGISLFSKTYPELKALLKDSNAAEDSSGITYKTLGFSVYAPEQKEIESILVFCKGYFD